MRLIDACALQEEYKARHSGKRLLLIDVAPTVDAVPVRRGRWVKRLKNALGYDCTACGKSVVSNNFDYCPNCGADMRGEQDV